MAHIGNFPLPAYPKPLAINPAAFVPRVDTYDWERAPEYLRNRTVLDAQNFYAPVDLPQGATITKLTLYAYRDEGLAFILVELWRADHDGITLKMAEAMADWTDGNGSVSDETVLSPVVDNENYQYSVMVGIDPNAAVAEVQLRKVQIDWH